MNTMKYLTVGILAHVDAGKTTLIESLLYRSGNLKQAGRVDHGNAFLDYDDAERDHGITIYTKEAHFTWKDTSVNIIDTPGHVDFSSEMERALQVLDLAVVVISGQDGVQSHTETIWKCLQEYHVPAVFFVNKMDIAHTSEEDLLADLRCHCSDSIIDLRHADEEELALVNEQMLEAVTEGRTVTEEMIRRAVHHREMYPVLFGSALKHQGTEELLDLLDRFSEEKNYPEAFGARVYKISSDEKGTRLTHVRITGGTLKARQKISAEDKADQIRIYNGRNYTAVSEVRAGMTCVLTGIVHAESGDGLGFEENMFKPMLKPFMHYRLNYPDNIDLLSLLSTVRALAAEDPQLNIHIDPDTNEINIGLMGDMQMEILARRIMDRCGIPVSFDEGEIFCYETIAEPVNGAGHFEPLRHYAEVHVRLEPLPEGSGIEVDSEVSGDVLSSAWQRTILAALAGSEHYGVLTGSPLTDVRIVLTAGRGHLKHTEGGDFREAALRAVRQALKKAECILLEPYYRFVLTLPREYLSRALYELETRHAETAVEDAGDETMIIRGTGPVRLLMNYQREVITYTRGQGIFNAWPEGYKPSPDSEKLIAESGYDSERDIAHPTGSVFCAHGAGYYVPWYLADEHMHIDTRERTAGTYRRETYRVSEEEMDMVLARASGNNRNPDKRPPEKKKAPELPDHVTITEDLPRCLLIDGYNMIFSWDEFHDIAQENISVAREKLIDLIYSYQAYLKQKVILVFDGYKVKDSLGSEMKKGDMTVVYTRSNMTADAYLERITRELMGKYRLTVASSDGLIQNAIFAHGALRLSARELHAQIKAVDPMFV